MGAVGPNHFVEVLNGMIAVYDKTGSMAAHTNMDDFFRVIVDGTNYPTASGMTDPRILFDPQAQRWVATGLDQLGSGQVLLAVSLSDSPTNLDSGWRRYVVPVNRGALPDFDKLGLDGNGIYVSVLQLEGNTNAGHTIVALKKPRIYQGTNLSTRLEVTDGLTSWTVLPAVNFDPVATDGFAWFVAKGPPVLSGAYGGGPVLYRRLQWSGTNAAWADTNWLAVSTGTTGYQDYYDLDGNNVTVLPNGGITAPQLGGSRGVALYDIGSRLMTAVVRNGFLWTCQTIGLSGTNGTYVGDWTGTNVDRSATQWLRLQISPDNSGLALTDHGRVFDAAQTNPWWYYFPSLMVNCAGDMVAGFSGSRATNYIAAFYTSRVARGVTAGSPLMIQPGISYWTGERWGDYSATTLDPTDDWSFWTVQDYSTNALAGSHRWATVVAKIRPSP